MSIDVRGLGKRYRSARREVPALVELDLTLDPGELLVVLGPSGSGKSTLLRCIAGLETVDEGTIEVAGSDVTDALPGDRDVAMVFQEQALYPHLDVATNIAFPLMARKTSPGTIAEQVRRTAEMLDLTDLLDRRPHELSGGERRRVALGRAVVRDPAAFLMDEPLANLDVTLKLRVLDEIRRLQRSLGTTTLYVTHDQTEAMALGDRIAVMRAGRIEQAGPPDEVHDRPRNTFVASFVGRTPMNLLPGSLLGDGAATVGLRPEHLSHCRSGAGVLDGEVTDIEILGVDRLLEVEASGEVVRIECGPEDLPALGSTVGITFSPRHVLRFSSDGGALG